MPEYLAPGVFVEEVSFRSKSIEGVSTTTTGFVGPTRFGPVDQELEVITSLVEYERTYGDGQPLRFAGLPPMHNYMWHAARSFFEEGGKRLYVKRIYEAAGAEDFADALLPDPAVAGVAQVRVRARFPGTAGARRVRITLTLGPNVLAGEVGDPQVAGVQDRDVVWISNQPDPPSPPASPPESPPAAPADAGFFALARTVPTPTGLTFAFTRLGAAAGDAPLRLAELRPDPDPGWTDKVRVLTATVSVLPAREDDLPWIRAELPLDPAHRRAGTPDSLFAIHAEDPPSQALARINPIVVERLDAAALDDGLDALRVLRAAKAQQDGAPDTALDAALAVDLPEDARSVDLLLTGGGDGARPGAGAYAGIDGDPDDKLGLRAFEDLEDISIVAAPGSTFGYENGYRANAQQILGHLIGHAERMRYRIAVLDAGEGQTVGQVRTMRGRLDSKHAALYYPWVRVLDPITQQEIVLPPSGFVSGIYARNDINRAVYKAPANEVVVGAIGFENLLNKAQQEVLNPLGVNCFRFFEGRGFRLWGARTISSDPEWKYVNLRRYFAYLERSIDRGTQWAVFEPNGEALWANVRRTISDFLLNEYQSGALLGGKPEDAYFVKCDRSTMTQNDLDNGRLVCLVGVAALRPAEFVIFRIGQWTANRKA